MSGRVTVTTGTLTLPRREAERAFMHPFLDLSVDPESDPAIEENYDGIPGDHADFDTYEVIDILPEDFAL